MQFNAIQMFRICSFHISFTWNHLLVDIEHVQQTRIQIVRLKKSLSFYIKQFDIYIKIKKNYPFSRPIIKYMNMDYINYYLKKSNFYNFDIKIECITWVPTLRINNIIIDYIKYNKIFSNAYKYIIIYNNLNSLFDDLIYYSIKSFIL